MMFSIGDHCYNWVRKRPLDAQPVQLQSLRRYLCTNAISSCYYLMLVNDDPPMSTDAPNELAIVLSSFDNVFQKPTGLPPSQCQDHAIHLHPYPGLVNIKPYRYTFSKNRCWIN